MQFVCGRHASSGELSGSSCRCFEKSKTVKSKVTSLLLSKLEDKELRQDHLSVMSLFKHSSYTSAVNSTYLNFTFGKGLHK